MRIASWQWGGRDHLCTISPDGRETTPLADADASCGVLPLIQALARGEPLPQPSGLRGAGRRDQLARAAAAPPAQPVLRRPQLHAHAAKLAGSVFRDSMPKADPWPIVFGKLPDCVIGPFDTVQMPAPAASIQNDYESELTVVIGRGGRDIPRSRAMDHVFAYTIANDVTARDVHMRHQEWDLGKSFDTSARWARGS